MKKTVYFFDTIQGVELVVTVDKKEFERLWKRNDIIILEIEDKK